MTEKTVPGSCFCGAISFEIDLPTLFCGHCHCSMCRRPHGASFVTWTAVPPEQFRFTGGEALVQSYQSSEHGVRKFCKICGTQMICQTEPEAVDVTLASLHGEIDQPPSEHWYYDSRARWTVVNDDLPKRGGDSGMELL